MRPHVLVLLAALLAACGPDFELQSELRRVRVLAWRETAAGRVVASDERVFERTFEPGTGPRRERADGRIEGEARFTLDLAADEAAPRVTVQLFYERGASRAGDTLSLFSSDVLHERTVTMKGPR